MQLEQLLANLKTTMYKSRSSFAVTSQSTWYRKQSCTAVKKLLRHAKRSWVRYLFLTKS